MELSDAIVHVRSKDHEGALRALLSAWRTTKHPRIAAVIDKVDRRIKGPKRVPGSNEAQRVASWFALAKLQQPEMLSQLVSGLWPADEQVAARMVEVLASWPADPRFTGPLCAYMRKPLFTNWSVSTGFTDAVAESICDLLWASGDVRVCRQILELDHPSHPLAVEAGSPMPKLYVGAELAAEMRQIPLPPLSDAQCGELAELERMLRMRNADAEERAFAMVYGQRDAPEARAVFVDRLHELRHPAVKYFDGRTHPKPATMVGLVPDALYDLRRMGFSNPGHLVDKGRLLHLPTADRLAQPHWANLTALWLPVEQEALQAYSWFAELPTVLGVDRDTARWAVEHGVTWQRLGTEHLAVLESLAELPTVTHVYLYLQHHELKPALAWIAKAPQVTKVSVAYAGWSEANKPSLPGVEFLHAGCHPDFRPLYEGR